MYSHIPHLISPIQNTKSMNLMYKITSYTPHVTVLSNPVTLKTIPDSLIVQPYLTLLEDQMSPSELYICWNWFSLHMRQRAHRTLGRTQVWVVCAATM